MIAVAYLIYIGAIADSEMNSLKKFHHVLPEKRQKYFSLPLSVPKDDPLCFNHD